MLYLCSLLNLSSVILLNDLRQNTSASSIGNPRTWVVYPVNPNLSVADPLLTLRKRPYSNRLECGRCLRFRNSSCWYRIHSGKCLRAISSIASAVTPPAVFVTEEPQSKFAPDKKPWDKLFNNGTIRVSSSSRGNAFAVACRRVLKKTCASKKGGVKPLAHAPESFGTRGRPGTIVQ
jgi:hypothetical protein